MEDYWFGHHRSVRVFQEKYHEYNKASECSGGRFFNEARCITEVVLGSVVFWVRATTVLVSRLLSGTMIKSWAPAVKQVSCTFLPFVQIPCIQSLSDKASTYACFDAVKIQFYCLVCHSSSIKIQKLFPHETHISCRNHNQKSLLTQ